MTEYKIGDIVKIISNDDFHGDWAKGRIGKIVKIVYRAGEGSEILYKVFILDKFNSFYVLMIGNELQVLVIEELLEL
jgi:hypothetical protein